MAKAIIPSSLDHCNSPRCLLASSLTVAPTWSRKNTESSHLSRNPYVAPTSLTAKARGTPAASRPCLISHHLMSLIQPHGPPCCSVNTAGSPLPQGLCMCCSLCLELSSSRFLHGSFPQLLGLRQMSPTPRFKVAPPPRTTPCPLNSTRHQQTVYMLYLFLVCSHPLE